jgi:SHAQKYF class myb-like DNA-binding protein
LRESLQELKQICTDVKAKLKKRKYVQTALNFGEGNEAPKIIKVKENTQEWINRELNRVEKEEGKKPKIEKTEKTEKKKSGSDGRLTPAKPEKWTDKEHEAFLNAIRTHGKNWAKIAEALPGRTRPQIASHSQKWRKDCSKHPNTPGAELVKIIEAQ